MKLKPGDQGGKYHTDVLTFFYIGECNLPALKILLKRGADINSMDGNNQSLTHSLKKQ